MTRAQLGERFARWECRRYSSRFEGKPRWAWRVECWLLGLDADYQEGRFMFLGEPSS